MKHVISSAPLLAAAWLVACHAPPPKPAVGADVAPAEKAALDDAWPALARDCAPCHSSGGAHAKAKALHHFDMSTYPFGGHHAATIGFEVREALGLTGKKATMPANDPGSVRGADLAAIDRWAQAWIAAHPEAKDDQDGDVDEGGAADHDHDDDGDHDEDHDHDGPDHDDHGPDHGALP